jgi:hypothetical protein
MSSSPSSNNKEGEKKNLKLSTLAKNITQQPQVVVIDYSKTKKKEPTAVSISQTPETDSEETSNTTESSRSLSSTKTSVESIETSPTSSTAGKPNPFIRRGRSKRLLQIITIDSMIGIKINRLF